MLAETRAELDEFHHSSKELEEELIRELERTEKAQQDLKVKVAKAENDRDEWKVSSYVPCNFDGLTEPCRSPSSCLFKPLTIRLQLPSSANWINYGRNTRRPKYSYATSKWEMMI